MVATNTTNGSNSLVSPHELGKSSGNSGNVIEEVKKATVGVGKDFVDAAGTAISDAMRQILGQPVPMDLDPSRFATEKQKDQEFWKMRSTKLEIMRQEENALHVRKEQEQLYRIDEVRQVLKTKFTRATTRFAVEAEIALGAAQNSKDIYTEHFLSQLLSFLVKSAKEMKKATNWLATQNVRAQKRLPFFMQSKNRMQVDAFVSGERSMSYGG